MQTAMSIKYLVTVARYVLNAYSGSNPMKNPTVRKYMLACSNSFKSSLSVPYTDKKTNRTHIAAFTLSNLLNSPICLKYVLDFHVHASKLTISGVFSAFCSFSSRCSNNLSNLPDSASTGSFSEIFCLLKSPI